MFSHMFMNACKILKESYMTELIQLVMADSLDLHIFAEIVQVCFGRSHCSDTGAREADLGSGSKFIYHIRIAGLRALVQDLEKEILILVIKMMNTVSVVPVNTEVRSRRLQVRETLHRLL